MLFSLTVHDSNILKITPSLAKHEDMRSICTAVPIFTGKNIVGRDNDRDDVCRTCRHFAFSIGIVRAL